MTPYSAPLPAAATAAPNTVSRPLPPYRGIVAVDAKDFTGRPAIEHAEISRSVPELLEASLNRAGLAHLWADRRFPNSTGDGYVFGFDPAHLPFMIHPWLNTLQDVLTRFNAGSPGVAPIRLRVSLHVGPLPDSGGEFDGNGTARNDTHRLLDSVPVKAILAASSESITQVAAILSDRAHQDAVAGGYAGRHPDHFLEVPATVEGKTFAQRAWLYIPAPSGNLYDRRILGEQVMADQRTPGGTCDDQADDAPATRTDIKADNGIVNTGRVSGGQHLSNRGGDHIGDRVEGSKIGSIGGEHIGGDNNGHRVGTVHGNLGDVVRDGQRKQDR
ncbi:hypothetical protein POF50_019865 [Streptomyces sp. SL13]|uniref:Uncharacterized protein n=1 Tax=Streptantibioticus silvisoli TaxID=2705255 RepID=A0AA90H1F5_9ACTN|nr:hypothetical protein [Streptantibioticus silvisoli]MDI5965644.1 hypothetical protein [Streptantibioticus silvisoli]MDI5971559.1 hypothetical protein [Streptantibioticus silvisoli]